MTVIATIITSHFTAHATDSLITQMHLDGTREVIEDQLTKIIRVEKWRGAMSYWGLARHGPDWSTLDWLRRNANQSHQYATAEEFARATAKRLSAELDKRSFQRAADKGIGIHFTAYEQIGDYWVPELFQIRNWQDPSYSSVRSGELLVTRETFGAIRGTNDREDDDRLADRRMVVHRALQSGHMFIYNNGDPVLFNPVFNTILGSFQQLMQRGLLRDPADVKTHLSLVQKPVELVSELQTDLVREGQRLVGGRPHALAVSPNGNFTSFTGD